MDTKLSLPIMLALCLMLSQTYYVQNYAGIIGLGLLPTSHIILFIELLNPLICPCKIRLIILILSMKNFEQFFVRSGKLFSNVRWLHFIHDITFIILQIATTPLNNNKLYSYIKSSNKS